MTKKYKRLASRSSRRLAKQLLDQDRWEEVDQAEPGKDYTSYIRAPEAPAGGVAPANTKTA